MAMSVATIPITTLQEEVMRKAIRGVGDYSATIVKVVFMSTVTKATDMMYLSIIQE